MDLSELTDHQKAMLVKFREIFKDTKLPDDSDLYLLRWLVAREFDLTKAEKMLRTSLEWRRQYRIDHIRDELKSPEVLKNYFPAGLVGRDKFLHPLWVVRYGQTDMKGILLSAKKKDYLLHVVNLVETSIWNTQVDPPKYQLKLGKSMIQSTIIFDMDGFSMRHITYKPAMESSLQLVQMYEANYPEWLRKVFVINAPKVFSIAFSMIKPFLHERTKNKISIFGHEPNVWKAAILAEVNAEELPTCYGGTMTDPDGNPNCITKVNLGGSIPKSFYFSNQSKTDITVGKKSLTVASGTKEHLEFQVKDRDSVLRWEFCSEDSDVAFGVYLKKGSEMIPVVPHDRVESHVTQEEGEIRCEEPGTYVVEFDNSYSYLKSKKIWHSISVELASALPDFGSEGTKI